MDSFSLFRELGEIAKGFGGIPKPLNEVVAGFRDLFEMAHTRVDVRVGELLTLDDEALAKDVCQILKNKPAQFRMTLTCGNKLVCGVDEQESKSTENHFTKMLLENFGGDNSPVKIYFNPLDPIFQMQYGYLHEFILDTKNGDYHSYFESPHSYHIEKGKLVDIGDSERQWWTVKNSKKFAMLLDNFHQLYVKIAKFQTEDIPALTKNNTFHRIEFAKRPEIIANTFSCEEEWLRRIKEYTYKRAA